MPLKKVFILLSLKRFLVYAITLIFLCCATIGIPHIATITHKLDDVPAITHTLKSYDIYVDLENNSLSVFENGTLLKGYTIASGKNSTPSPIGIWKIINKGNWGQGFGGCWLGLNVPWGIYGIHGTTSPWSIGQDSSHGCIRMLNQDIEELYTIVQVGTPVVISAGPYGPFSDNPRVIIPGDRGSDIFIIQRQLKRLGLYKGALDGIYGDNLKDSLFEFQRIKGYTPHHEIYKYDLKAMGFDMFE
jgi:hypothetical protein